MKLPVALLLRSSRLALSPAALFLAFTLIAALLLVAGPVLGQTD